MKKKMTIAQKMRWTAGALYLALSIYQVFTMRTIITDVAVSSAAVAWVCGVMLAVCAGVMAVWMFTGKTVLSDAVHRAVVVGTSLVVVYEAITLSTQIKMIGYTIQKLMPGNQAPVLYTAEGTLNELYLYFFVALRLVLIILAAFFVCSSKKSLDYVADDPIGDRRADDDPDGPPPLPPELARKPENDGGKK